MSSSPLFKLRRSGGANKVKPKLRHALPEYAEMVRLRLDDLHGMQNRLASSGRVQHGLIIGDIESGTGSRRLS